MTMPDANARLASLIKDRRKARRLSITAAAREAGIDRATWASLETGARRLREHNYAGVERALAWMPRSIDAILSGGEPVTAPVDDVQDLPPRANGDDAVRIIWESDLPRAEKLRWIERLLDERDLAERRRAELAREAVRTWERAREAQ